MAKTRWSPQTTGRLRIKFNDFLIFAAVFQIRVNNTASCRSDQLWNDSCLVIRLLSWRFHAVFMLVEAKLAQHYVSHVVSRTKPQTMLWSWCYIHFMISCWKIKKCLFLSGQEIKYLKLCFSYFYRLFTSLRFLSAYNCYFREKLTFNSCMFRSVERAYWIFKLFFFAKNVHKMISTLTSVNTFSK